MGKRIAWFLPLGLCLGCAVFPGAPMPGESAEPLSEIQLAAQCLEKGDDVGALPHLSAYVEAHPEQPVIRVHLAEVMLKLDRKADAKKQFEQYIRDAQPQGGEMCKHVIHVHTRLVELAQAGGDEYGEHLNRGIGLLLLAEQLMSRPATDGDPNPQKLLVKAVGELKQAGELQPDAARPRWYLSEVYSQLGQQSPARRCLRRAHDRADFSDLTPAELQAMSLTWQAEIVGSSR